MKRKCPRENRNPARDYGVMFEYYMLKALHYVKTKDQNYTILVSGKTGSGKSSIDLHMWNILEGDVDFERVAFTIQTTALGYDKARKKGSGAFFHIDELKLYSRRSMNEFNVDFLDLLFSIRGQNLILAANAPSPNSIDKIFIQESLIDVLIFIHKEQARFLWIEYKDLMKLLKDKGNLNYDTIAEHGEFYAKFDTYFSPINKTLWKEYEKYKVISMEEVGDKFVDKYAGGARLSCAKAAKRVDVSPSHLGNMIRQGIADKALPEELQKPNGQYSIPEKFLDELRLYVKNNTFRGGV